MDFLQSYTKIFRHFSMNKINSLPENIFKGLSSLTVIDFKYNKIESLPENIFNKLSNLSHIDVEQNEIESLPENIFKRLTIYFSYYNVF